MKVLVTGAAGFVGSTLVDQLLAEGRDVLGIDAFTPSYPRRMKELNLEEAHRSSSFSLIEADLATADLAPLLDQVDVVFHAAAQPGVRGSWGGFEDYVRNNVLVTQRLLEAARQTDLARFVYSSSSSVYGNSEELPTRETSPTRPHSPYGVTKLAGEHLCAAYAENWGLPTVSLRYFTVYGPRQRPDMAIHRLFECAMKGSPFPLFGNGEQQRDFTYIGDALAAVRASMHADLEPGTVINVGGGAMVSMNALMREVSELVGRPLQIDRRGDQPGDVQDTSAAISRAKELLGWEPATSREEGLRRQFYWHLERAGQITGPARTTRPLAGREQRSVS